jgi:hypothetical protein
MFWELEEDEDEEDDSWRGDLHLEDWPEELAGPEYWLYKRDDDNQQEH